MINLLQKGPVAVAVAVKPNNDEWMNYKSDSSTIICSGSGSVDHVLILVGYTPDAYIVRNSWGETWGDSGYAYVTREEGKNCGILVEAHVLSKILGEYQVFTLMLLLLLAFLY
jgi:hypothetical protein